MKTSLKDIFETWQYNPLAQDALYSYARTLTYDFEQKDFDTNDLNCLGGYYDDETLLDSQDSDDQNFEEAAACVMIRLTDDLQVYTKRYFLEKTTEQQLLQDTVKVIYFLQRHLPQHEDLFHHALMNLGLTVRDNDSLLNAIVDDHVQYCQRTDQRSELDVIHAHYKTYMPRTVFIPPKELESAIPLIKKYCAELEDTAMNAKIIKSSAVLRQISAYRTFAMRSEYPDIPYIDGFKSLSKAKKHRALTQMLGQSLDDANSTYTHSIVLRDTIIDLACQIFPKHIDMIETPYPRLLPK